MTPYRKDGFFMQLTFNKPKKQKLILEVKSLDELINAIKEHGSTTFTHGGSIFKIDALYISSLDKKRGQ